MSTCVVIKSLFEAEALTLWGIQIASSRAETLNLLYLVSGKLVKENQQSVDLESTFEVGKEDRVLLKIQSVVRDAIRSDSVGLEVQCVQLSSSTPVSGILSKIKELHGSLLVLGKYETASDSNMLSRKLFQQSPCATMLIRPGSSSNCGEKRILIPVSGGPHAAYALRLGEQIAQYQKAKATALFVEPYTGDIGEAVGAKLLKKVLGSAGVVECEHLEARVHLGTDVKQSIQTVASEGFCLILLGASNTGSIRRVLFGTIPDQLLLGEDSSTIAVIRRSRPILERVLSKFEGWLDVTVPQLEREDRIALFENLQLGTKWNFDFFALMALSTSIAALGLVQDSTAVVIGAMLVAPLMTPLLGAGLSLVQGNLPLMLNASRAIFYGFLTALAIAFGIGFIVPGVELTPELIARGGPTILDLGIALFSGMAAAYSVARPNLSAALPGVAIAAALVPPIATTGIALAISENLVARGAATLFGTNVVAIVLGASFSFYAGGIRWNKEGHPGQLRWARQTVLSLLLAVAVLSVPLGSVLLSKISSEERMDFEVSKGIESFLESELKKISNSISIKSIVENPSKDSRTIDIFVRSEEPISSVAANKLSDSLQNKIGSVQKIRIYTELVSESGG